MLRVNICQFMRIREVSHLQCCVIVHKMQVEFVFDWCLLKNSLLLQQQRSSIKLQVITHSTYRKTNLLSNTANLSSHHLNTMTHIYTYSIQPNSRPNHTSWIPVDAERRAHSATWHHQPAPSTLFSAVHLLVVSVSANNAQAVMRPCSGPFPQT